MEAARHNIRMIRTHANGAIQIVCTQLDTSVEKALDIAQIFRSQSKAIDDAFHYEFQNACGQWEDLEHLGYAGDAVAAKAIPAPACVAFVRHDVELETVHAIKLSAAPGRSSSFLTWIGARLAECLLLLRPALAHG